jgi:hypothetical protein
VGSKDDGCIRLKEKTYRLSMFLLMELLGPFLRTAPPRVLPLDFTSTRTDIPLAANEPWSILDRIREGGCIGLRVGDVQGGDHETSI